MASDPLMRIINRKTPAPGWVGGFSTSDPQYAYPEPNLTALPMLHNMDNIRHLHRQLDVLWPEFSWETKPGDPSSRCYSRFAPDISRAGYNKYGRIYSIICPQQGIYTKHLGDLNIEVTVTSNRGWVDETVADREYDLLAADMTVSAQVWFGPTAKDKYLYQVLEQILAFADLPFPLDKANAIQLDLHHVGDPGKPIISIRSGATTDFPIPERATHTEEAWAVANVAVQIGAIKPTGTPLVDDFNAMVMDIFNLVTGNLLSQGNVLTWNVWVDAPGPVDQAEWKAHAEKWRHSIDTGHGSPDGNATKPQYFDGTYFEPEIEKELDLIKAWLRKWLEDLGA